MSFGERLRGHRIAAGMSQVAVAETLGVSLRTIRKYEKDITMPNVDRIRRLATSLQTSVVDLVGDEEAALIDAYERGGGKARRDLQMLSKQVSGLFAGGDISEGDMEAAMLAIQKAYWLAKEKNQKFTPKAHRKTAVGE